MSADQPTIIATSIGLRDVGRGRIDAEFGAIFDLAFDYAGGPSHPKMCFLPTASGDSIEYISTFYGAAARSGVALSHLALFPMPTVEDIRELLLGQDVIWVGGGSVAGLLAMWELHGLGPILRDCWEAGVVLGGVSAGSICWHLGGTTDSFGPTLRAVTNGLEFLPYSNGVHYDSEEQRRPLFQHLIATGALPAGFATDDGAGLVYRGTDLTEAVSDRTSGGAYLVEAGREGNAVETPIDVRRL